ncbi:MAG: winged helix-turn-helix domain-containing protein [Thermoplasmata archaeon]
MKKLTIPRDKREEIIEEIRRNEDSKYDHRLHGILLVANGMSPYQVSGVIGNSPKSIENWVNIFLNEGFEGLRESRRSGRPTRISGLMDQIGLDLRKSPMDLGYSQNLWDGKLLSHHIKIRYGIDLGTRQCQRIFRKLGFRLRKPRPVIAKGDAAEKGKFKKNS